MRDKSLASATLRLKCWRRFAATGTLPTSTKFICGSSTIWRTMIWQRSWILSLLPPRTRFPGSVCLSFPSWKRYRKLFRNSPAWPSSISSTMRGSRSFRADPWLSHPIIWLTFIVRIISTWRWLKAALFEVNLRPLTIENRHWRYKS